MLTLTKEEFRLVCAWCKKEMRPPALPSENPPESHGICLECASKMGLPLELLAKMAG